MGELKKLLIIGGTGFIGRHLVLAAVHKGYKTTVLSLHNVESTNRIDGVDYLISDVVNYNLLKKTLSGKVFTHVVNLGGYINHARFKDGGRQILDAHFLGLQNLVELLDWNALKMFVQIGSSDEYGDAPAPQGENIREKPISSYSLGKLAASQMLQMLHRTEDFPAVILRLFLVYGPGQDSQRFIPQIINGCLNKETFATSHGQQLRDFCYIDDVIKGIILALDNNKSCGEIINIASGKKVKIHSVIEEIVKIIGSGIPKYGEVAYRKGENMSLYANVTKARELLNWQADTSLSEGITKTIEYYEKNR